MVEGEVVGGVILVCGGREADPELVDALGACGATVRFGESIASVLGQVRSTDAVVLDLGDDRLPFDAVADRLPPGARLIAIGDPRALPVGGAQPDCVLFAHPDEMTVRGVLTPSRPIDPAVLLRDLVNVSVFGADLATMLQDLATRLARAFGADECIVMLPEEGTCFSAREVRDEVIADLETLCETVCQIATTVIAPPRPDRPYRAFLGVPLAYGNAPPLARLLFCRVEPVPFGRDAIEHVRAFAERLRADLSWRLVHERLMADRDRLRELSRIDPVLGIANRAALQEELSRCMAAAERRNERISVAVIDVDGLRLVNERNGYPAGDAVLTHIAQVARLELRGHDIIARYAGDSVAIVMPGASAADAQTMLTRVLTAIDATPVLHEDVPINLTVSAGVAELRDDRDTGEAALARAMAARDRARVHGDVIGIADGTSVDIPAAHDYAIGTTLGGVYQIRHEISRGAFGVVYRAVDLALGRQVALKLLRTDLARDTNFVESFRTEAATLARIRNPNLVQVYAFGVDGSNVFFAMELIEGQGLDKRIYSAMRRRRHLPLPEVLGIVDQVAGALEAMHRANMLHRDVKPENVLVDRIHRRCVLVDVGISVRRGEKKAAGTPGFTAPEVFGELGETPATDVYGLAALTYMLLTLRLPFSGATPVEILRKQSKDRPRPPTEIRLDLPDEIDGVLLGALDPDPARRPQSARDLAKALSASLANPEVKPRTTVELERPIPAPGERRRSMSLHNSLIRAPRPPESTRGVLFRSAYEVLGAKRGATWITDVSRKYPEIAAALGPQSSSTAWYPTSAFVEVLHSLGETHDQRRNIALHLGKAAIAASFGQFYGADPSASTPAQVLRTADLFGRCYHSWGEASVIARDTDAQVTISGGIVDAVLCASSAGLLAGVVAHAGGLAASVEHTACRTTGADRCVFRLGWRLPAASQTS